MLSISFATNRHRGVHTRSSTTDTAENLPWERFSASQHQAFRALYCVIEHLFLISTIFASISKMCLKAIFALLYFDLTKGFIRMIYFGK